MSETAVPGYTEFEFDLPGALLANLVQMFAKLDREMLTRENVARVPEEQGVYQLFLDDELVYIGKTDNDAGLNRRLTRHSRKIQHRKGLDPARVSFRAIRIFVFTAVDLESDLIRHYGGTKGLAWNGSGFGSNDPGRERDTTKNKPTNFDALYPADIDRPLGMAITAPLPLETYLATLRTEVPYTIRVQRAGSSTKMHSDLQGLMVPAPPAPLSARQAISHLASIIPSGWQATKLLGYIIIYKEEREYPQSEILFRT